MNIQKMHSLDRKSTLESWLKTLATMATHIFHLSQKSYNSHSPFRLNEKTQTCCAGCVWLPTRKKKMLKKIEKEWHLRLYNLTITFSACGLGSNSTSRCLLWESTLFMNNHYLKIVNLLIQIVLHNVAFSQALRI